MARAEENVASIEAGLPLDIAVATALGWRIDEQRTMYDDKGEVVWLKCPLGDTAWEQVHMWKMPHYSADANIRLPMVEGEEFQIHELWSGKCVARIYQGLASNLKDHFGEWMEGDTIAEARCRAWLVWKTFKSLAR